MYTSFFGFTCKPFQLSPDPEFLFMSRGHKRALTFLNYGMADNAGFILVTGEIGVGKTTILRSMIKKIPQDVKLARINNTKVTSDQLISMINEEYGIDTKGDDKTRMLSKLTDFLISQYAAGGRSMIIIDEAQNLSPDLLEEIRLLSNLETDKSKLLQIILVGQPELDVTLSSPGLEQLRQRIAINTHINPLSLEETEAYIRHRLKIAGNEEGVTFQPGVVETIYDFSKGVPRLINMICDFTLLAAFVDNTKTIDLGLMKETIRELAVEKPEVRAAALRAKESPKNDDGGKIKRALASINLRLQNLEAVINGIQEGGKTVREIGRLIALKEGQLSKKEEELLKRECELLEKEELLKRREDDIRSLFKQNLRVFPSRKEQ
jgi:general secretion pathway protein A